MHNLTRPSRVLVVDDEPHVARLLEYMLQMSGYEARAVLDGEAALAHVAVYRPDAVVLDLSLPGLSGVDVLQRLPDTGAAPVVLVLTSRVSDRLREDVLAAGARSLLAKPVAPSTLVAELTLLGVAPSHDEVVR